MEQTQGMDDEWIELDDAPDLVEGPPPKVSVVLLNGAEVVGPFHRAGPTGPLVEVYEAEVDSSTGRGRMRRVGLVGLVPHTAGPDDLLALYGAGVWICQVRNARGQLLGTQWVATGTKAQREKAALVAVRKAEAPPTDEAPVWLQRLMEAQRQEAETLRRQVEALQEAEKRRQEADQKRLADEVATLRAKLERQQAAPSVDTDPIGALKRKLKEADELRAMLHDGQPEPEEPESDFLDEANETMGKLMGQYGKVAGLMDKLAEGE